jgi:hypothetical protein
MMAVATHRKPPRNLEQMGRLRRFFHFHLQGSRKRSVLAAVTAYRLELREQEPCSAELANRIVDLLDKAEEVARHGNIQAGWACFLAARRMQILTASPDRISAESIALLEQAEEQAEELSGWRGKAIKKLLNSGQQAEPGRQAQLLYVAYEIRHEAQQNTYRKVEILREQLLRLGGILTFAVFGLLLMAILRPVALGEPPTKDIHSKVHAEIVIYVALFGALGGSISAIQWVIKASTTDSGLPERRMYGPMVYMRPLFGLAAALAVFPFFVTGILPVPLTDNARVFSVALVAGFTERFIASAVRTVTAGESKGT